MSSRRRPHSRRRAAAGAAAACLAVATLSACGVANDGLDTGLAAQVGDTGIGLSRVDTAASDLCEMVTFLAEDGSTTAVAGSVVRDNSLQYVVLRELADQLSEEYDVEAGEVYDAALEQNQTQLSELGVDQDLLDDVVPTISSVDYFFDIVQQIGQDELGLAPEEDTTQEGFAEGLRIAQEWEAEHGLEVNPRFADVSIGSAEELVTTEANQLSVPVSDFAKQASEGVDPADPDTDYAAALPESQRCG